MLALVACCLGLAPSEAISLLPPAASAVELGVEEEAVAGVAEGGAAAPSGSMEGAGGDWGTEGTGVEAEVESGVGSGSVAVLGAWSEAVASLHSSGASVGGNASSMEGPGAAAEVSPLT